jgi:hypothetical protein
MKKLDYDLINNYITSRVLTPFYAIRLASLSGLQLHKVLKRKNPYLFRAKNILTAEEFVKSILSAFISSQEETIFGDLLEGLAIFIAKMQYDGSKSALPSLDLEFLKNDVYHLVSIKSGTNWGNADQIRKMKDNFKSARTIYKSEYKKIKCVNGCIYGKEGKSIKDNDKDKEKWYWKLCGQEFWFLISDDNEMYKKIILPLGKEISKKDDAFKTEYAKKVNEMTGQFIEEFIDSNNEIDWDKLIEFVSKKSQK